MRKTLLSAGLLLLRAFAFSLALLLTLGLLLLALLARLAATSRAARGRDVRDHAGAARRQRHGAARRTGLPHALADERRSGADSGLTAAQQASPVRKS